MVEKGDEEEELLAQGREEGIQQGIQQGIQAFILDNIEEGWIENVLLRS